MAVIDKRRTSSDDRARAVSVIGEVAGMDCVLLDDEISTGGTMMEAAEILKADGAARVCAYATHGVFGAGAVDRVVESPLDEIVVTDTIPVTATHPKIRILSVADLFGEAIRRLHSGLSLTEMVENPLDYLNDSH
jgi:ribose-phosphate pyrophosphokinase